MSDLRSMLEHDADDFERTLIRAGRADGPRPEASMRALQVLGVGVGVGTVAGSTAASTATSGGGSVIGAAGTHALGTVLWIKWLGIGMLGGLATVGTIEWVRSPGPNQEAGREISLHPHPAASASAEVSPSSPCSSLGAEAPTGAAASSDLREPVTQPIRPRAVGEPPAVESEVPEEPTTSEVDPAAADESVPVELPRMSAPSLPLQQSGSMGAQLAEEVRLVDAARHAHGAGNQASASAILDAYQRKFPRGHLVPEATMLRLEVLVARGERARARTLARSLLRTVGEGAYSARLREIAAWTD